MPERSPKLERAAKEPGSPKGMSHQVTADFTLRAFETSEKHWPFSSVSLLLVCPSTDPAALLRSYEIRPHMSKRLSPLWAKGENVKRCNMSFDNFSSMEDISLVDEEGSSMEFRVLMAYTQRRLSASKFSQLLERGAEGQGGSVQEQASLEKPPADKRKSQKKKKKKTKRSSKWKRFLSPRCLRGQTEEDPGQSEVNGKLSKSQAGIGRKPVLVSAEAQEDLDIARVADKLAELVDHSRSCSKTIEGRGLVRTMSLEKDGGGSSKLPGNTVPYEDDRKDDEEKIIDTIVAMLRKTGDRLEEKMQKDKTFHLSFCDLMSYSFFRRIADQFLEEVPVDSTGDSEAHVQRTKVAYVMEVTTRLTAVDNHPMNLVLGFGTKYLKENFRPWICSQGGLKKAVGLLDHEDVE